MGGGRCEIEGNKWGLGKKGKGESLGEFKPEEEYTDAMGNTHKVKAPKKKLSRKEIKSEQKKRKAALERGDELSENSDWELDIYVGEGSKK